jgi:peptidoglycan/xylan/chitin deacetylase (PgdA/CDA1 family)
MHARRSVVVATALALAAVGTSGAALAIAVDRGDHVGGPATAMVPPTASATASATVDLTLQVNGAPIPAVDNGTVAAALTAAGITVPPGQYLAVVSHRHLGSDGQQGRIYVDDSPATLTTPVFAGEQVTVRPGADRVEPTETIVVRVESAVRSGLYVGNRPGITRVVRGRLSHERVSESVVRPPTMGHLIRPGAVALTFDDGPSNGFTLQVLALLRRHHVHATFCMIGRQAAARPWLVRAVARDGNALCDHTWDHDLRLRSRPKGQIRLDIRQGRHAIVAATGGQRPTFFRAPGGNWSAAIEKEARAEGMTPLGWTVDTRDWSRPGTRTILRNVYTELKPGGVILMHDGGGDRSETLAALRVLLRRLPKMGYHFVLPPKG